MKAILFDTETTGLIEPQLIEAAWMGVRLNDCSTLSVPADEKYHGLFRPSKPIEFGAMATHHITDEDLTDCQPSDNFRLPDSVQYLIGHNIDFDWKVIGSPDVRRIDTLSLCRSMWPEADSHKQTAMLYMLDRRFAKMYAKGAHSANADVFMLSVLLEHIVAKIGGCTVEQLWKYSEKARIPTIMPFGKHKGELIADVPLSYRRWLMGTDIDQYLRQALESVQ